jgi:hypothetical protein
VRDTRVKDRLNKSRRLFSNKKHSERETGLERKKELDCPRGRTTAQVCVCAQVVMDPCSGSYRCNHGD